MIFSMRFNMKNPPLVLNEHNIPDLPWTIEAEMLSMVRNISIYDALDLVVIKYLQHGDNSALKWSILSGLPLPNAVLYVAHMMDPEDTLSKSSFPFEFKVKSRTPKKGRPSKQPKKDLRDWLIFKMVRGLIEKNGPGYYDGALSAVADLEGLSVSTVKRAHDKMKAVIAAYSATPE
jgi:hypothetical protein